MLSDTVNIGRRFQKSIKIDSDYNDSKALEGFICPKSSVDVLQAVARHVSDTGHGAFTWTGPYGSGKSSLVVALSALLGADDELRKKAKTAIGREAAEAILNDLPLNSQGWQVLPVVGKRATAASVIGNALEAAGVAGAPGESGWSDDAIVASLSKLAKKAPETRGGVILFIDEMGKFLEAATQDGADLYLFQLLAEAASRSNGRLIVIGILHQAFEDYANRLSREMRDEWSKIQGRFIDLAVNAAGEEQIELISRAIENGRGLTKSDTISDLVASEIKRQRPAVSKHLAKTLEGCWPLHPTVACLLGPISRRRFGQNQRSIFGFLNSAEPHGFQDFIRHTKGDVLYEPDRLWDYLRVNLEPSILASPDGHRWAMAAEAVERCEALGGSELQMRLLKTIALIDLFKERSGLMPTEKLLAASVQGVSSEDIEDSLSQLKSWSLVIFRKFVDAYAIYAGSDFDIDHAIESALQRVREVDFSALQKLAGLQPILAKRHYHDTGALRWFDVEVVALHELTERSNAYKPRAGIIGAFILSVPTEGERRELAEKLCREAAGQSKDWDVIVGLSHRGWIIVELARELMALGQVLEEHPDLAGDVVAQREIHARKSALQGQLEEELKRAFDNATWYVKDQKPRMWDQAAINNAASDFATKRFPASPKINNELLNRIRPSSNAVAAQNALLRAMVAREGVIRLGIEGYPAEGGLFASVLEATGLYRKVKGKWQFCSPTKKDDPGNLVPLWNAAIEYLKNANDRTVTVAELYNLWGRPPFGLKEGLTPVMVVAFILTQRQNVALYRSGIFQARFKDIDVEILAKDPAEIQLRWMDLSDLSRRLLSSMAEVVRDLDTTNNLAYLTPIDVARGLIAIFDRLHPWTKRTSQLSSNAIHVRDLFKHANDPNKFLFDDIPAAFGERHVVDDEANLQRIVKEMREGLEELIGSYPSMLRRLYDLMLGELQVPNNSPQAISELRERAENIREIGGDFRLNAFIGRLSQFEGRDQDLEGIASLSANKPPRDWTDPDLDRASVELADFSQKFVRAESFARVKGRVDKRHAMAVVVGLNGRPTPLHAEFEVTDSEREAIDKTIECIEKVIEIDGPEDRKLLLAALAELSSRYMDVEGCKSNTLDEEQAV